MNTMCCQWLGRAMDNMNHNGLSVVPRKKFGARYFALRFLCVDPALWAKLECQIPQMTPFAQAAEMVIQFCPGCGANLKLWIANNGEAFEALTVHVID